MLILCMMNVWSSRAPSYRELLGSRILSGFAAAAADATVPAVVGDMVAPHVLSDDIPFGHDRGSIYRSADQCVSRSGTGLAMDVLLYGYRCWGCFAIFTIRETSYIGGRLIDIISTRLTNRRGGQRVPEYRLPAIMIPGTIGPAGTLTFGLCVANRTHWIGAAFGYAMQALGVAAISNVAVTYSLDCYKRILMIFHFCFKTNYVLRTAQNSNMIE